MECKAGGEGLFLLAVYSRLLYFVVSGTLSFVDYVGGYFVTVDVFFLIRETKGFLKRCNQKTLFKNKLLLKLT